MENVARKAHINIGSNIEPRLAHIGQAVSMLKQLVDPLLKVSRPVETPPWGFTSPNDFMNVGVLISTPLPPSTLQGLLQDIQSRIDPSPHRDEAGNYIDRKIDIDFIAMEDEVITTPALTLPHPRMSSREFVLLPMIELDPTWKHPLTDMTPLQMLSEINKS